MPLKEEEMDFSNKSEEKHIKKKKLKKSKTTVVDNKNCCVDDLIPLRKMKHSQTEQTATLEPESYQSSGSKKRNKDRKKKKREEGVNQLEDGVNNAGAMETTENLLYKKKKKKICDIKHVEIHQDLLKEEKKQRKKEKEKSEKLQIRKLSPTKNNLESAHVSRKLDINKKDINKKAAPTEKTMGQSKKKKAKKEKHLSVSNTVNYPEQSEETNTSEETVANTQEWGVAAGGSDCDNVETKKKKKKAKRKCDVTDRSEDCMNKDKVNNKEKENVLGISNMETEKVDKKKKKKKKSDDKGEKKNAKSSQENEELFLKHGEYKEDDKKEETVTVVTSKKINKVKRQENDHMFYANNEQTKERLETEELFIGDGENEINEKKEETPRNAKEKTRKKKVKDEDNNVRHDGSAIKKRKKESCRDTEELLMEYEEKPKSEKKAKKKRKIEEKVEEPLKSVHVDTISSNQICKASQPQETPARPLDLGQWTTAEFNSSQQQHKFLSLMGAFKKGFQPAAAGKGKPNMAMGKEAQQQLQQGLLGQFEHAHSRTMNFNKRGAGLGFTPLSNKKFSIDINACRSVHFDP